MLIPLAIINYKKVFLLAFLTTLFSVLGGCIGYLIGYLFFDQIGIQILNWLDLTKEQLDDWGCRYHDVRVGKPHYDLFICDKSKRIEEL